MIEYTSKMKVFFTLLLLALIWSHGIAKKKRKSSNKGICELCHDFASAFEKGLKNTEKSTYTGGDAHWEEKNNKVFANSEIRLVEILDSMCSSKDFECIKLLERYEEDIEKWWLKLRNNGHSNFRQWLCYTHADVCCPKGTYGQDCKECPGGKDNPCSGHGTCKGEKSKDDKKGAGTCVCNKAYKGELCDTCNDKYYLDENKLCKKCDDSCKECTGPGPFNCTECAKGFKKEDDDNECKDIDECVESGKKVDCLETEYCNNIPGGYECVECHFACKGPCTGSTVGDCVECKEGYQNVSGQCKDIDECDEGLSDCKEGTYCENRESTFLCRDCDYACIKCTSSGPEGCTECANGFAMKNDSCEDIDECEDNPDLCNTTSELCINDYGSYSCKCKAGYTRVRNHCITWEEAEERQRQEELRRGKKKKVKSTDDNNDSDDDNDDDDDYDEENGPETAETESEVNAQPSNTPTDINSNDKESNVVLTSSTNEGDTSTSDSLQPNQPASPTEASEPSPTSDKHEEL